MTDPGFTTEHMTAVFSPSRRVAAFLEFEAALALALADAGIAPADAAEAVAKACAEPVADPDAVLAAAWSQGTPLLPLLAEVRGRLEPGDDQWLHHGATTQDALDTATMLQARDALNILEEALAVVARLIAPLVEEHRYLPHLGRTFLQHARATTFGTRLAGWLHGVVSHVGDVREAKAGLVVQLGGPVGDLGPYGDKGTEVVVALAQRIELGAPGFAWHTDRSRVAAIAAMVERVARTMATIGVDIALLASSEIAEVRVRAGGSSSIAGKKNPIDAVRAVAAAGVCSGAARVITSGRPHELDRSIGGWQAEWVALPLIFETTAAAVEAITTCFETLEVDAGRMAETAGPAPMLDPRPIDRALADFEAVVGR